MKKLYCNARKGSAVFVVVIILALVSSMLSLGMAKVSQAAMSSTNTNKTTSQAQQYAESKAGIIKSISYGNLASQSKSIISNSGDFYDEVVVGSESTYPSDEKIKQKECLIRVYKGSETVPRASLRLMRYSVEASSVPQGTILSWFGQLANIPSGFAVCDGKNGTPDLRNRFIVGAGDQYKLSATGGEDKHILSLAEMPSHNHDASSAVGYFRGRSNAFYGKGPSNTLGWNTASGCFSVVESGLRSEGNADSNRTEYVIKFDGSKIVKSQGDSQAHENRPPYYALYFIMKL